MYFMCMLYSYSSAPNFQAPLMLLCILSLWNTSDSYSIPTANRDSYNTDLKIWLILQYINNVQYVESSCVCFRTFVSQHSVSVPLVLLRQPVKNKSLLNRVCLRSSMTVVGYSTCFLLVRYLSLGCLADDIVSDTQLWRKQYWCTLSWEKKVVVCLRYSKFWPGLGKVTVSLYSGWGLNLWRIVWDVWDNSHLQEFSFFFNLSADADR